jgi:hypothetical protein
MKYALFAFGLLLLLFGGYSVYSGSGIIEAERGWASVIAGTVAVVGGVLAIGLGWAIKALEDIRILLQDGETLPFKSPLAPPRDYGKRGSLAAGGNLPPAPVAWPPHTSPLHTTTSELQPASLEEPAFSETRFAYPGTARDEEHIGAEHIGAEEHISADVGTDIGDKSTEGYRFESFAAETKEIASARLDRRLDRRLDERPAAAEPPKSSPSIKDIWRRVAKDIDKIPSLARSAVPKTAHGVEPSFVLPPAKTAGAAGPGALLAPHDDQAASPLDQADWLDHALAELDSAIAETPLPRRAEIAADIHQELPEYIPEEAMAPPLADDAMHTPDFVPAAEEPAVIGRYDADGTCYVMFADGSIEAQSEQGVARFNSMAELKAYFETQEAPQ